MSSTIMLKRIFLSCFTMLSLIATVFPQGIGVGQRFDLSTALDLDSESGGQFAQLFIPDYYAVPGDGCITLVFHLHSATWAAENIVYKSRTNAILFNIHLGALSSPYKHYFQDKNNFQKILDVILETLHTHDETTNFSFETIIITSFSAGYAAVREILKKRDYYECIHALILADGLHSNSELQIQRKQMKNFVRFARDACRRKKIMIVTHSEITTVGYASTTETADYLLKKLGGNRAHLDAEDEIGIHRSEYKRGNFILQGYAGYTAEDHMRHLHGMFLALHEVVDMLKYTKSYN